MEKVPGGPREKRGQDRTGTKEGPQGGHEGACWDPAAGAGVLGGGVGWESASSLGGGRGGGQGDGGKGVCRGRVGTGRVSLGVQGQGIWRMRQRGRGRGSGSRPAVGMVGDRMGLVGWGAYLRRASGGHAVAGGQPEASASPCVRLCVVSSESSCSLLGSSGEREGGGRRVKAGRAGRPRGGQRGGRGGRGREGGRKGRRAGLAPGSFKGVIFLQTAGLAVPLPLRPPPQGRPLTPRPRPLPPPRGGTLSHSDKGPLASPGQQQRSLRDSNFPPSGWGH